MSSKSLISIAAQIRSGATTPIEQVELALDAADRHKHLNALTFLDGIGASEMALQATEDAKAGIFRGPLHGLPVTIKDLFNVEGMPMTASTAAPLPSIRPREAVAVQLLRAAGAIVLGKANMHEIALGITGEFGNNGPVRNPFDSARQSGGSSSGSAVCVAVGIGLASLGSDTAGSIRGPAAYCGVVGFKPTYGSVSLQGALPLSWTCDHAGPLTSCVADARTMFGVLSSRKLPASSDVAFRDLTLGIPTDYLDGWLTNETASAWQGLIDHMRRLKANLIDIQPVGLDDCIEIFNTIREPESAFVHRQALSEHPDLFREPMRSVLLNGFRPSAVDYFAALSRRDALAMELAKCHESCDAILLPTQPAPAPVIGTSELDLIRGKEPLRNAFIRLMLPFSLCGLPAISVPFASVGGLPLGVQVVCRKDDDVRLLDIAESLEHAVIQFQTSL